MSKIYGYARVSTDIQDTDNQKHAINNFVKSNKLGKMNEFFTEIISSGKKERRIFSIVEGLQENDTLIVYENSRLARNTDELSIIIKAIQKQNATLYIVNNGNTPVIYQGKLDMNIKMFIKMVGVVAEYEKDMIRSRVRNSLRAKKIHGTNTGNPIGKPPVIEVNLKQIAGLRGAGHKWDYIQEKYGVSRALYFYHKNKEQINEKLAKKREAQ